jgi:eukaryotic-like serine/threonine-protein kinase
MTPERWQQIKELFNQALDREAGEREAFLNEACNDEMLRQEVYSLLTAHEESDTLIDKPAYKAAAELLASNNADIVVGRVIGHYRVERELGQGGMGEVYLAEDTRLGRRVALKMLPIHFTRDSERVRRFQQEARAASALNHPNIVTIHEIGEREGLRFIVTEYIEGETLRERMEQGRMRLVEVVEVGIQTASALMAAHEAGIAHRDIKPENIMLRSDGYVKVVDFGLAKLTERQDGNGEVSTDSGVVIGTVRYMSPEQACGKKVDIRTDIFSFGVVLYEMVAGRVPFDGESNGDVIAGILRREAPPLSTFSPDLPVEMEKIIKRAIRKEREGRYQTIKEMLEELKELKLQLEQKARRDRKSEKDLSSGFNRSVITAAERAQSTTEILKGKKKYNTGLLITVAGLIVATSFAAGLYKWVNSGVRNSSLKLDKMRISKLPSNGNAFGGVISPDGKYIAYIMRKGLWVRQVATNSPLQVLPPADVEFWGIGFSRDSNFIYYVIEDNKNPTQGALYKIPSIGGTPRKLMEHTGGSTFSPDDKQMAFIRNSPNIGESALMLADMEGRNVRPLSIRKSQGRFVSLSWSPDGKMIAATVVNNEAGDSYMTVVGLPIEGGPEIPLTTQRWPFITTLTWLPDGSGLILNANEQGTGIRRIWRLSYPDGGVQIITSDYNSYLGISLTSDATAMVTSLTSIISNIWIVPGGNAGLARQVTTGVGNYSQLDFTNDRRILYSMRNGDSNHIFIMDIDGGRQSQLTFGPTQNVMPTMTADGRYIVYVSNRGGKFNIWRMNSDGSDPRQLTNGNKDEYPVCSPDGKWIFFLSDTSRDWALLKVSIDGGEALQLYVTRVETYPAISPDGKLLAYVYSNKEEHQQGVVVRPLDGGPITKILDISPARSIRWAWDGKGLLFDKGTNITTTEIFYQPLSGGAPKQLTNFKTDEIFWYDWSPDGKYLVCSRGTMTSDIVMITNFNQ